MRRWWLYFGLLTALVVLDAAAQGQVGFDRPGGDYASFPMRSGDPAQCAAALHLIPLGVRRVILPIP